MAISRFNLEDFRGEKLSLNQQKMVRGGDGDDPIIPPTVIPLETDPGKGGGGKGNN